MRLVVLSTVLPLVLGVTACVAPDEEASEWGFAPADEMAAEPGPASPEITEKATEVVNTIAGLLKLNRQWNERLRGGATTPEAQREIQQTVQKMRDTLATLPDGAGWVTSYVQENRDAIQAGFAKELASEEARTALGADEIRKLTDAVNHAGGIDALILKAAGVVHDHSQDVSDMIGKGKKMPLGFFCGLAGTIAGANAAQEDWLGVVGPIHGLLRVGCIR